MILSRFEIEGTFPLSAAMIDAPTSPDIVVSLRWTGDKSRTGLPGMSASDAKRRAPGQGIHASLSRFELHNTLIAAGPGIRRDFVDMLPSGNADVAPTVLALLAISSPSEMDGRVLEEALSGNERFSAQLISETLKARHRGEHKAWRQYLHLTRLGSHVYLDEGNGEALPLDKVELANSAATSRAKRSRAIVDGSGTGGRMSLSARIRRRNQPTELPGAMRRIRIVQERQLRIGSLRLRDIADRERATGQQ